MMIKSKNSENENEVKIGIEFVTTSSSPILVKSKVLSHFCFAVLQALIFKAFSIYARYANISKDVKAGDEILHEIPFAVGPKLDSPLCCLGCYRYLEEFNLCETCGWPVCGADCSENIWHKGYECQIFASVKIKFNTEADPGPQLECIAALRALLAKERNPERWEQELSPMMDHNRLRMANEAAWEAEGTNIVTFLRDRCQLADRFSEDLIRRICGIMEVNSFEVIPPQAGAVPIRGIYPKAAIPSHNCVANTTYTIHPEDFKMVMRTTVDLKQGSEVFCTYTTILDPTLIRRWALKCTKYFDCDCERCKDPKELGTHLSSIKCPSCDNGLILSTDPLDATAEWKCTHCDKSLPSDIVQRLYFKIRNELAQLEDMELGPEKLEMTEKILRMYKSSLHPRHGFNIALMHTLVELYGRVEGYTMDMLPDILLERKAEFGQRILDALDVVKPGLTRMRGRILFELHVSYLMMARTQLQLKVVSLEKFKEQINKVIAMLEESARILGLEPPGTPDYLMAQNAQDSVAQLAASLENMHELPE